VPGANTCFPRSLLAGAGWSADQSAAPEHATTSHLATAPPTPCSTEGVRARFRCLRGYTTGAEQHQNSPIRPQLPLIRRAQNPLRIWTFRHNQAVRAASSDRTGGPEYNRCQPQRLDAGSATGGFPGAFQTGGAGRLRSRLMPMPQTDREHPEGDRQAAGHWFEPSTAHRKFRRPRRSTLVRSGRPTHRGLSSAYRKTHTRRKHHARLTGRHDLRRTGTSSRRQSFGTTP
jgi:hypothetical protein